MSSKNSVLITSASTGIGAVYADRFASAGVTLPRLPETHAAETVGGCRWPTDWNQSVHGPQRCGISRRRVLMELTS